MTDLSELWTYFKLLTPLDNISPEEKRILINFLTQEQKQREVRRIRHLLKVSGIKRIKRLEDFNWTFNPKIPRDKIMAFVNSDWIKTAANLVLIGSSGLGKTHIGDAICYLAVQNGYSTVSITSHDLVARFNKTKNPYNLIDYYARVKVFCLDELGYVFPSQENTNYIFQIISKRSELLPTIITTNLIPSQWGKLFDAATATAILDRLSLKGTFITFEGRSYRSKK